MSADETGSKRQEIPLRACSNQYFFGIDADTLENHCQFIDQCNVDVALRVLDDFRRFSDLDARRLVCARGDDRLIHLIDVIGCLGR